MLINPAAPTDLADDIPLFLFTVASPKERSPYGCTLEDEVAFWMLGVSTYGASDLTSP